jgi:soluble lytic murein transglycosylase
VQTAAQLTGLMPEIVYGVLRQESLYRTDAVSTANARGLMQLQLDTARRTARQWKQAVPSDIALFEPSVSVVLGAGQLKLLLDRFGGQLPVALAAYNAGPNAAQRWLPAGPMDPDIWIENIPYNETRGYVQRILWHSVVFAWLPKGQAQDTSGWLKGVQP